MSLRQIIRAVAKKRNVPKQTWIGIDVSTVQKPITAPTPPKQEWIGIDVAARVVEKPRQFKPKSGGEEDIESNPTVP